MNLESTEIMSFMHEIFLNKLLHQLFLGGLGAKIDKLTPCIKFCYYKAQILMSRGMALITLIRVKRSFQLKGHWIALNC